MHVFCMSEQDDQDKRIHRSGRYFPTPGAVRQPRPGNVPQPNVPVGLDLADFQGLEEAQGAVGGLLQVNVVEPVDQVQGDNLAQPDVEGDNLNESEGEGNEIASDNEDNSPPHTPPNERNPPVHPFQAPQPDPQHPDLEVVVNPPQPAPQPPPQPPPPPPPPQEFDQAGEVEAHEPAMAASAAHRPQTFEGLSNENPTEFLRLFEVFCTIHGLALQGADNATAPSCNRFAACITGDAARWYMSLPDGTRVNWPLLRAAFVAKYCDLGNDWTESVMLRSLRQRDSEPVELFLNRWVNQVRRMGLDPDQHLSSCVDGLLMALKTKVILAGPNNFDSVARHAKLAEIVIRQKDLDPSSASAASLVARLSGDSDHMCFDSPNEVNGLVSQVQALTTKMKEIEDKHSQGINLAQQGGMSSAQNVNNNQNRPPPFQRNNQNPRGEYSSGNWNRSFQRKPGFQGRCFKCNKFGHRASECRGGSSNFRGGQRNFGQYRNQGFRNQNFQQNQGNKYSQGQGNNPNMPVILPVVIPSEGQQNRGQAQQQYYQNRYPSQGSYQGRNNSGYLVGDPQALPAPPSGPPSTYGSEYSSHYASSNQHLN